jgi:hypothetical protein
MDPKEMLPSRHMHYVSTNASLPDNVWNTGIENKGMKKNVGIG